jgi:hypothetical protein
MNGFTIRLLPASHGKIDVRFVNDQNVTIIADQANLASIESRKKTAQVLCQKLAAKGFERTPEEVEEELEERWLNYLKEEETRQAEEAARKAAAENGLLEDPDEREQRVLANVPQDVQEKALELLKDPELVKIISEHIQDVGVAGEEDMALCLYLMGTSRKLEKPLAVIVKGPTSSGKSFVVDRVAGMFPRESVIRATQLTPQALFHMPPGALRNKLLVAGERRHKDTDDTAEATRALREMLASGRLSKLMPVKIGGEIVTVLIEQEGPIGFVETTSQNAVFEEDENRCVSLFTDEREEQTAIILAELARGCSGEVADGKAAEVQQLHQTMQRLLRQQKVIVPFSGKLAEKFPKKRVEARRAFPHLLSLIQASALLHQFQRERDDQGRVIAVRADYALAIRLLSEPMERAVGGGISQQAARFCERLWDWFANQPFSSTEAKHKEENSQSAVYGWLAELHRAGRLRQIEAHRGPRPAVWTISDNPQDDGGGVLPRAEDVFEGE